MDSTKLLNKCTNIISRLKNGDSDTNLLLEELFESLFILLNKYKVRFDIESFIRVANKPFEPLTLNTGDHSTKVRSELSLNAKKCTKRLLNQSVACLLEIIQEECHFEESLDRLVELLEHEYDVCKSPGSIRDGEDGSPKGSSNRGKTSKQGPHVAKNMDFMDLFLTALFYGNFYHLGIVQHFLLNSRHSVHLPHSLNNIIKNRDGMVELRRPLNGGVEVDSDESRERFYERLLIFVTKLNTPDGYKTTEEKVKVLRIPRKELGIKNIIGDSTSLDDMDDREDAGGEGDLDSSEEDRSVDSDNGVGSVDEDEYGSGYIRLWESILDDLVYRVGGRSLVIILESLPTRVFPYIYNPLKIANFLHTSSKVLDSATSSTSTPSVTLGTDDANDDGFMRDGLPNVGYPDVVINSLNCLFELVLYYNLTDQIVGTFNNIGVANTPRTPNNTVTVAVYATIIGGTDNRDEFDWFYRRLDGLIAFEYLCSGSSVVLIRLIERALNSSMLPNKLVSYFVKRLMATATLLDTSGCNCLLVIALHLLQKHHQNLLHQVSAQSTVNTRVTNADLALNSAPTGAASRDSMSGSVTDAITTGDVTNRSDDSLFLHELYLLLHHFNNDTVKVVGIFFTHLKNKISFSLGDFIGTQQSKKHLEKSKSTQYSPFRASIHNSTTVTRSFFK